MMDRLDLDQAVFLLQGMGREPEVSALKSRDALMAYALVHTICHYWPSRMTPTHRKILSDFAFLKTTESSRFIKQRRILLRQLLRNGNIDGRGKDRENQLEETSFEVV